MDYILEEMERQRLMMERLLTPTRTKGSAEEAQEDAAAAFRAWSMAAEAVRSDGITVAEWARALRAPSFASTALPTELPAAQEIPPDGADNMARQWMRMDPTTRRYRMVGNPAEPAAAYSGRMTVRTEENRLRLAAQEVSRAVEREARRYDGGYEMY